MEINHFFLVSKTQRTFAQHCSIFHRNVVTEILIGAMVTILKIISMRPQSQARSLILILNSASFSHRGRHFETWVSMAETVLSLLKNKPVSSIPHLVKTRTKEQCVPQ